MQAWLLLSEIIGEFCSNGMRQRRVLGGRGDQASAVGRWHPGAKNEIKEETKSQIRSRRRRDFRHFPRNGSSLGSTTSHRFSCYATHFTAFLSKKNPEKIRIFDLFRFGFLGGDGSPLLSSSVPFLDLFSSPGRQSVKSDRSAGFIFLDL